MLRGLTGSSVLVTGTQFIDILKSQSLRVAKAASGDLIVACGAFAREQVLACVGGYVASRESVDSGSGTRQNAHGSRLGMLRTDNEQFREGASPRSSDRGPIEAGIAATPHLAGEYLSAVFRPRPH
jgi:hypothetical protein